MKQNTSSSDFPNRMKQKSAISSQDGKYLYKDSENQCMHCHDLCLNGCFGPKKTECYDCKSAKMKKYIPKMENSGSEHWILECLDGFDCPAGYYFANETSFCEECSNRCNPKLGF